MKPNAEVAQYLKDQPGQWFRIAVGERHRAHVFTQTAHRINQNYKPDANGVRRGLAPFAADGTGEFQAVATADERRQDKMGDAEIRARWKPVGWVD